MWLVSYIAFLILISNFGFILVLMFRKKSFPRIKPQALNLALLVAFLATIGSLVMSNVLYLPPCELCWFQRIFMYPLVIILSVAKIRKINYIWEIVIPLTLVGGLIATYHYLLQLFPSISTSCGFSTPCSVVSIKEFGYITIPWMSLTAFVYVTLLMIILKSGKKKV